MIAPCDFDMGGPANREAQKAGIVGISTCASSPLYGSVTLGDKQFTLSMWNTTMGAAAAEYAFNDKGWKNAYVVTDTFIDYTTSLSEYFIEHFKDLGGTSSPRTSTPRARRTSPPSSPACSAPEKPDVIFISSYMPDLGTDHPHHPPGRDRRADPRRRFLRRPGAVRRPRREVRQRHLLRDPQLHGAGRDAGDGGLPRALPEGIRQGARHLVGRHRLGRHAGARPGGRRRPAPRTATEVAKAMENTQFHLLTGKLRWTDAAQGHEPDIEAALVELEGGKPRFIGWRRPSNVPKPRLPREVHRGAQELASPGPSFSAPGRGRAWSCPRRAASPVQGEQRSAHESPANGSGGRRAASSRRSASTSTAARARRRQPQPCARRDPRA